MPSMNLTNDFEPLPITAVRGVLTVGAVGFFGWLIWLIFHGHNQFTTMEGVAMVVYLAVIVSSTMAFIKFSDPCVSEPIKDKFVDGLISDVAAIGVFAGVVFVFPGFVPESLTVFGLVGLIAGMKTGWFLTYLRWTPWSDLDSTVPVPVDVGA